MVSAPAHAYMGVWGLAPSVVQGQSPWLGGLGTLLDNIRSFMPVVQVNYLFQKIVSLLTLL